MNHSPNIIDFGSPDVEERIERLTMPRTEEAQPVSDKTLVKGNEWLAVDSDPRSNGALQGERHSYEDPLTAELIMGQFSHAVSMETGDMLFTTVPGSTEFEQVVQKAEQEVVQHYLWRMGLPSELASFVDFNHATTRQIFEEEYRQIPEDTKRDNSTNAFGRRWSRIQAHIIEEYQVSKQDLQDKVDVWRDDLQIRRELTADDQIGSAHEELDALEQFRPGYTELLGRNAVKASEDR